MTWLLAILLSLSTVADVHTSNTCQSRGCVERDPVFGRHPSPGRLWAESAAITGAEIYGLHATRKKRVLKWAVRLLVMYEVEEHTRWAYLNTHVCEKGCYRK